MRRRTKGGRQGTLWLFSLCPSAQPDRQYGCGLIQWREFNDKDRYGARTIDPASATGGAEAEAPEAVPATPPVEYGTMNTANMRRVFCILLTFFDAFGVFGQTVREPAKRLPQ